MRKLFRQFQQMPLWQQILFTLLVLVLSGINIGSSYLAIARAIDASANPSIRETRATVSSLPPPGVVVCSQFEPPSTPLLCGQLKASTNGSVPNLTPCPGSIEYQSYPSLFSSFQLHCAVVPEELIPPLVRNEANVPLSLFSQFMRDSAVVIVYDKEYAAKVGLRAALEELAGVVILPTGLGHTIQFSLTIFRPLSGPERLLWNLEDAIDAIIPTAEACDPSDSRLCIASFAINPAVQDYDVLTRTEFSAYTYQDVATSIFAISTFSLTLLNLLFPITTHAPQSRHLVFVPSPAQVVPDHHLDTHSCDSSDVSESYS